MATVYACISRQQPQHSHAYQLHPARCPCSGPLELHMIQTVFSAYKLPGSTQLNFMSFKLAVAGVAKEVQLEPAEVAGALTDMSEHVSSAATRTNQLPSSTISHQFTPCPLAPCFPLPLSRLSSSGWQ
jgi:hypothetical protein